MPDPPPLGNRRITCPKIVRVSPRIGRDDAEGALIHFLAAYPCHEQQNETDYDANSGQPIAPARVDRLIAAKRVRSIQLSADIRGQAGDDAPVRIHRNGETVI